MPPEKPTYKVIAEWTRNIEDAGATWRVYFCLLIERRDNGEREWHYFGETVSNFPLPHDTSVPVTEHPYVVFPTDLQDIPDTGRNLLYPLATKIGMKKIGYYEAI